MKNQMEISGSKTVWNNLSIICRKGCSFIAETLCTINFWLRQTTLCKRMPLVKGRMVSSMASSNGKKVGSLKIFDVICAQTKSPEVLIEEREMITLGLNLDCDKSVNGNCTKTMSRWLNTIDHFFKWANTSSHLASSELFHASARETSETRKYGFSASSLSTFNPISSATRISKSTLSDVSVTMLKTVFMLTNIGVYLLVKKTEVVKCLVLLFLFLTSFGVKAQDITAVEYFFNTDPGSGNLKLKASAIPVITLFGNSGVVPQNHPLKSNIKAKSN